MADGVTSTIRRITPAGEVTTFAGSGSSGNADGTGIAASFTQPAGLAFDAAGNLFVSDISQTIRRVTPGAVVTTLAAFGVPRTLADPKLEVYSGASKIAENDNWAASLAPTFTSVGAFQLTAGSRDAALVITLPPGGYTVQVPGADGGTGEAVVELYELP